MRDFYLLVGLGNPGPNYRATRHNIGFMVVDEIARIKEENFRSDRNCLTADFLEGGRKVILMKPITYMNKSGIAVSGLLNKFNVPLSNLLIISDDFNLPFGKLRLRGNGSDGGHNGLASIIQQLGTRDFPRLRIGIGQEKMSDTVSFVLSNFNREEKKQLPEVIERAAEASLSFIVNGLTHVMNKYNVNLV